MGEKGLKKVTEMGKIVVYENKEKSLDYYSCKKKYKKK